LHDGELGGEGGVALGRKSRRPSASLREKRRKTNKSSRLKPTASPSRFDLSAR